MTPVLEFKDIARAYRKGETVLDGVSFQMREGEVVGLLGRNGAGKTTLIRIAMGMLQPQRGEVLVFGLSPMLDPVEVKRRIGYVSEDQALPPRSTVAELIAFHRKLFATWDAALERQLLERFGLRLADKIHQLSKGQARQVALLCAICHRPELLILDEPAGGLDPAARREFLEASIQLLNREGSASLFSSHHMGDVERLGGRVILLDKGKVLLDRELDSLHEKFCVALAPAASAQSGSMERMPGCLRTRLVGEDVHAVFEGEPAQVAARLSEHFGAEEFRCSRVPLEDLFVELVGGSLHA